MCTKLISALAAASAVLALSCGAAFAYEGPLWGLGESYVEENTTIKSTGEITLEDSKLGISIVCKASGEGKVGSQGKGEINSVSFTACKPLKVCGETEVSMTASKTPWSTQLEEHESGPRDKLTKVTLTAECLVLGMKDKDECTFETTTAGEENLAGGANLVFDSSSAHGNCSIGGAGAGVIKGTDLDENKEGKTLAVEKLLWLEAVTSETRKTNGNRYCEFAIASAMQKCRVEIQNHSAVEVTIKLKDFSEYAKERYSISTEGCVPNTTKLAGAPRPGTIGGTCSDTITPLRTPESWLECSFTEWGVLPGGEQPSVSVVLSTYSP